MSAESIREAVAREAEAAEAEEPEPDEPKPDAPEPEPEPEVLPVAEAPAHEVDPKQLEKALRAHEKAIARVMGVEASALHVCDTCGGVGYTPEGYEPEPEVLHDPDTEPCPACNGYGQRLTGARPPAQIHRPCTACAGGGYVTKQVTVAPLAPAPSYFPEVPGNGQLAPTPPPDPAAVAALRAAGFTVIEPYTVPPTVPS